jgi:hypothetical protein
MCAAVLDHQRPRLLAAVTILVSRNGIGALPVYESVIPPARLGASRGLLAMYDELHWDLNLAIAGDDGEHVAVGYDATMTKDGDQAHVAAMEVYRVVDGEITEMLNGGGKQGLWL